MEALGLVGSDGERQAVEYEPRRIGGDAGVSRHQWIHVHGGPYLRCWDRHDDLVLAGFHG
jgi:hypothetical protein